MRWGGGRIRNGDLFAEQLRDDINHDGATKATAENEIDHRIAGSGNGQGN